MDATVMPFPPDSLTPDEAEIWTAAVLSVYMHLCPCDGPMYDPHCSLPEHRAGAAEQNPASSTEAATRIAKRAVSGEWSEGQIEFEITEAIRLAGAPSAPAPVPPSEAAAIRALDAAALWEPEKMLELADTLERKLLAICEAQYLRTIAHRLLAGAPSAPAPSQETEETKER